MKNKKNLSSPWAILPLLFCSVAVLAGEGGYDGDINGQQQGVLLLDDAQNPDTVILLLLMQALYPILCLKHKIWVRKAMVF